MIALKFINEQSIERYICLEKYPTSIGNTSDSDIRLHTLKKDAFCFSIIKKRNSYILKSENKNIFLNNEKIQNAPLLNNDNISINNVSFTFLMSGQNFNLEIKSKLLFLNQNLKLNTKKILFIKQKTNSSELILNKENIETVAKSLKKFSLKYFNLLHSVLVSKENDR